VAVFCIDLRRPSDSAALKGTPIEWDSFPAALFFTTELGDSAQQAVASMPAPSKHSLSI
jgi:hypothetical protein